VHAWHAFEGPRGGQAAVQWLVQRPVLPGLTDAQRAADRDERLATEPHPFRSLAWADIGSQRA